MPLSCTSGFHDDIFLFPSLKNQQRRPHNLSEWKNQHVERKKTNNTAITHGKKQNHSESLTGFGHGELAPIGTSSKHPQPCKFVVMEDEGLKKVIGWTAQA